MNILVTGGAGYVGSHAARLLARRGHEVWVYDNLVFGHRAAVAAGPADRGRPAGRPQGRGRAAGETDRRGDALRRLRLRGRVGDRPGEVLSEQRGRHAVADGGHACRGRRADRLLEHLRDLRRARGASRSARASRSGRSTPTGSPSWPSSSALADYARAYGWGYAALRYFNASGASADGDIGEDHDPETHLIPLVLQVALGQREHITVFGDQLPTPDGTCIRDYIHVDDLATAHLAALERLEQGDRAEAQPRDGAGIERPRGHRGLPRGDGPPHPGRGRRAPRRRPPGPGRRRQPRPPRAGLGAAIPTIRPIIETAWRWHKAHPHGYGDRRRP